MGRQRRFGREWLLSMFRESSKPKDLQSARSLNHDLVVPGAVEVVAPFWTQWLGLLFWIQQRLSWSY